MGRLFGFISNRSDILLKSLEESGIAPPAADGAFGVGFYDGNEVLYKKRPAPTQEIKDWSDVAASVKTDLAIIHFRHATVGDFRPENTHPFRQGSWLFAHVGTVPGFEQIRDSLTADLPDFLRRNVRGNTDSEVYFHCLLSYLHEIDALHRQADPTEIVSALAAGHAHVERLTEQLGFAQSPFAYVLSDGTRLFSTARGVRLGYRAASHGTGRSVLIATDPPENRRDYELVQPGNFCVVQRNLVTLSIPL